jgi:hypothetical protein
MADGALWTKEDLSDFDCACTLLASASSVIGVYDELAQEMVHDALQLLRRITDNGPVAVHFASAPVNTTRH